MDVLTPDYSDQSSITNWDKYGTYTEKDFKTIRYEITLLRQAIGYNNLPLNEKILANKYFASGVEYFNAQVTPAEQDAFFNDFLKPNSDTARKSRDLAVTQWVIRRIYTGVLTQATVDKLIQDAAKLRTEYLRDGTQGIGYNDTIEGVINFVKNDNGFSPFPIIGVNTATKTFTVAGDKTSDCPQDKIIRIHHSTGNNNAYTVVSSVFAAGETDITVAEAIPSAVEDGDIYVRGLLWYVGLTDVMQQELFDIYWNGIY
jgi:hypothetical protein